MNSCLNNARRCRPYLGTFVEISATAVSESRTLLAIDRAFAAVAKVHSLMSFFDPASDVARLNRFASEGAIEVHPWTTHVLSTASRLHHDSDGIFDLTVASRLQALGYLPRYGSRALTRIRQHADQSAMELLPNNCVRFHAPIQIDLGGIAKGFAVDQAIAALQDAGALAGCVNAGGDLRVFGETEYPLHVRHQRRPGELIHLTSIKTGAVATSGIYFSAKKQNGRTISPLINPKTRESIIRPASVSVQASTCLVADALTKVILARREESAELLRRYKATAYVVEDSTAGRLGSVHFR